MSEPKPTARSGSRSPFFNIGWRYLLRRPWQSLLMILGITLGVAVVVAIDLANSSASRAFALSTDSVTGKATHQITGSPEGLDENLYAALKRQGVEVPMAPVVAAYVTSPQLGGLPLQLFGVDPFAEAPFRSYLSGDSSQTPIGALTFFFTRPNAVLLSATQAERYNLQACPADAPQPNCTLALEVDGQMQTVFVAGLLDPTDSLSRRALDGMILADIAAAQELTGKTGLVSHIDLILPENNLEAENQIRSLLPEGVQLQAVGARTGSVAEMTSAFSLNLTALSLLALVVGLFLIYNTMTFSVVQRRPVFGTLRCLGVTRGEVFTLVVSEALLVGLVGSLAGIGLGIVLGQAAVAAVTQTISDLFFVLTVREVDLPTISLVKGILLGVGATTLTAAFPAWEAASIPPRMALSRSGLESKAEKAVGLAAALGTALIISGAVMLLAPGSSLVISFAGTFAVIIGFAMLTPLTTAAFMRGAAPLLGRVWGLLGRMAPRDVVKSLSRTSIAVAALMVAVSVTIGVNLMVTSFRYTVEIWLEQTLAGDVYISPPSASATRATSRVLPESLEIINTWPGVERVDVLRSVLVDSPNGEISVAATDNRTVAEERLFASHNLPIPEIWGAMEAGAVIISEPLANRLGITSSQQAEIRLQTNAGEQAFPVVGIYYDYTSTAGVLIMALPVYQQRWDDPSISAVALRLKEGADPDEVTQALQGALNGLQRLSIRPNLALRQEALEVFDRTFAITTALQLLATLVAFIGVLSALLSLQLERKRELGILRAVGLTGKQMRRLVILETGLMGTVAGLLSLPTGFTLAMILIYIINQRAFGWTLQLQLSAPPFLQAMLVAVLAAVLAGIYPALKISRMAAAEALRGE